MYHKKLDTDNKIQYLKLKIAMSPTDSAIYFSHNALSSFVGKAWMKCRSIYTEPLQKCCFKFVDIKCESGVSVVCTMYYLDVSLLVHLISF